MRNILLDGNHANLSDLTYDWEVRTHVFATRLQFLSLSAPSCRPHKLLLVVLGMQITVRLLRRRQLGQHRQAWQMATSNKCEELPSACVSTQCRHKR